MRPPGTIPLAVSLPRMLEKIEAELAAAGPAEKGASGGDLDVVGVYSARAFTGEASSLDVVVYNPKEITR